MGTTVTVSASPEDGYSIQKISYTPDGGIAIDITQNSHFTMPAANVTVSVTFKKLPTYTVLVKTTSKYPAILNEQERGTVTPSSTSAYAGKTVSVTVKAGPSYRFVSLSYTPAGGTTVDITSTKSFIMPSANVTVTATFELINPFVDVTEDHFYYYPVLWAYHHNPKITAGTDQTHFKPKKDCTRAEIVTFLWRAMGSPAPSVSSCPFTDVSPGKYYYTPVLWAYGAGVTSGVSAVKFAPDDVCTRAQIVTFLWRAKGSPKPATTVSPFTDVSPDKYYYNAVLWAVEWGVTSGTGNGKFSPDKTCTRGEVVTFLYRASLVSPLQ